MLGALLLLVLGGCRTGRNYPDQNGPRYAGNPPISTPPADTIRLKVVSFNVEFAHQIDAAITLLATDSVLRGANVLLLQEMNEKATQRVAQALDLWYVYYPAIYHFRTRQLFGNAVLSRFPIVEDSKIVLPHVSRFVRTQRTATAATLQVGSRRVRVYSTHLGTPTDIGSGARQDQLQAILDDAAGERWVILGGDMNDARVGRFVQAEGYFWVTQHGLPTSPLGRIDHIFLKGFRTPDSVASGVVTSTGGISDHRPVWAVGLLRP